MKYLRFAGTATAVSVSLILTACQSTANPQERFLPTWPGTAQRPVLSAHEASRFTPQHYFAYRGQYEHPVADGWRPGPIDTRAVNTAFVVGPQLGVDGATYTHVQQAVNAALSQQKSHQRIYIKLLPGTYTGTVYIPADAPPVTLFGAGDTPQRVVISLALDSMMSPAAYRARVNPAQQYQPNDPAWYMYDLCASKNKQTIDTTCAAVMWSQSDEFQLKNLTVVNALLDTVDNGTHQAVALRTDGDRVQLEQVRLIGRQDTFFVNTSDRQNNYVTDHYSRAYIKDSYIEGDLDYVFGRATAVFDGVQFHTVSSRGSAEAYVFAPDTMPWVKYGFLVINSQLTSDSGYKTGTQKASMGRAWDQGARQTGYLPGKTANGQLVIRNSTIDNGYDLLNPWSAAATTARPFSGNISAQRDLDGINFNRLWEYQTVVMK
ncbi:putative acyl-CoA thioester hydrolase [Erwiniaceae bacterium BAC15a-03b]|uniref:Pectinesterase n=1 Tax=Winslowiella arboricola TaxID=2978220 RepID=A0A9J6PIY5_9GAMM|nr:pectinesterase PemB [Winslowiella arboricola]MCU5772739.1 putative acyl-CoA thioester hydrolase [Winslowiella arboricola]MCU5778289.1 putative acyl-CoA thioester hydrolase [Winslowiella arboricola]